MNSSPEVIVITGPTAVGKTAAAIELARRLRTEVISADSMQVYKVLSIGTAKPTADELQGVTYHLVDFVDPNYQFNLGDYVALATPIVERLTAQGRTPIVCGGTCMYLKGLLHGVFDLPSRDESVRRMLAARCERDGVGALYAELRNIDPHATHIMPNDRQRILRALEVFYVTGKPISQLQRQFRSEMRYKAAIFVLNMERAKLYKRIEERVNHMLSSGWVQEVEEYMRAGYSLENPAIRALGYQEIIAYLRGETTYEEAVKAIKRKTRNFAKRQLTWLRAMKDATWVDVESKSSEEIALEIMKRVSPHANG
ncbi:MAG: tRNA (adenosine(37)-N6)-dimethylallyltransferase MiaA [Candidatus Sumerlaeaceae bacterium]|jgi:tRNA dimethylallyltransferase